MASYGPQEQRLLPQTDLKILVLGDAGAGKTSIIKRYARGNFSNESRPTLAGVDYLTKRLSWDAGRYVRLNLWDIAGQERLRQLSRPYYTGAVGAIIVFDLSDLNSFEAVEKIKQELDRDVKLEASGDPLPCVLLANKCDLKASEQTFRLQKGQGYFDFLDKFRDTNGFANWYETSAKENTNIDNAMKYLLMKIKDKVSFETSQHFPAANREMETRLHTPAANRYEESRRHTHKINMSGRHETSDDSNDQQKEGKWCCTIL